jgi:hypothetical protein
MSSESNEFRAALALAADTFRDGLGEDAAVERISTALGWSRERVRWFLSVNAERVQNMVDELRRQAGEQACGAGDE